MTGEIWILVSFFGVVMGGVTAAGYFLALRPAAAARGQAAPVALGPAEPEPANALEILVDGFRQVGELVPTTDKETNALRRQLMAAGYRSPNTVAVFEGLRCAAAFLLALVFGWLSFVFNDSASSAVLPAIMAVAFGFTLPDRVLRSMMKARMDRIRRALPDATDLMVLCVEAGHSLDQALIDASNELRRACPDLGLELAITHLELRAGVSRAAALRNLADRNPEPELRKLANILIQSDRFGTSLGPALRVHARYLRLRLKQQAEQAARKISVKLLFPIFFLIFPCMLMVTAGPALLQIFTQLLPMISGE